ncbi:cytochrome b-c1 complex subunit 2, mitochondrial [Leguminivora glycinivorella]|uniref:cytochrome b-c1 complex subunit 2, mitochondrial n=1 Tax=Leguminivora glycinivorella TaxID=1035111 RepID=UPI00200C0F0A|nr:cytochrome b-c1 complex subunit 2, mitochondrial [Leguminivora glycinivorella]
MASNALKNSIIRHPGVRGYAQAAQAAVKQQAASLQFGTTQNNTFIAALDNGSPITRVTVAFKAGARFEAPTELGLTHVLRTAAGQSTGCASGFILARKLAQHGASVTCSGDREFIYYTLEATKENLSPALECLNNLISNQEFRPWELSDNVPRLKYDIAALAPQVRAVDLLHKAAFRRGLGNSLFISPKKIGKVSSESLQHYAASTLTPARCAVAVIGESKETATMIAQALTLNSGSEAKGDGGKYFGGELRKETGGELVHVALGLQGAKAGTPQSVALAVAAKALGNGPVTKWGADNSILAKAIGNIGPFAAAGFNVAYSDNGLYGAVLSVPKDEAAQAIKAVATALRSPVSADAVAAAKAQLKVQLLSEADEGTNLAETIAAQGLQTGAARNPAELAGVVDKVTAADVTQAVAAAAKSPLTMASVGNLACTPYVDEL